MNTTTATETLRELMTAFNVYRAKWIDENGSDEGFNDWFTQQVKRGKR